MYKVDFASIPWTEGREGVRFKIHRQETGSFDWWSLPAGDGDPHWCEEGHIGYVLKGGLKIEVSGLHASSSARRWIVHSRRGCGRAPKHHDRARHPTAHGRRADVTPLARHAIPLSLVLASLLSQPLRVHAQQILPIIDMHLHASSPEGFGGPQTICTNQDAIEFPPIDPREPATVQKASVCAHPLMSVQSLRDNGDALLYLAPAAELMHSPQDADHLDGRRLLPGASPPVQTAARRRVVSAFANAAAVCRAAKAVDAVARPQYLNAATG